MNAMNKPVIRLHSDAVVNRYVRRARAQISDALSSWHSGKSQTLGPLASLLGPLASLQEASRLQKIAAETIMKEKTNRSLSNLPMDKSFFSAILVVLPLKSNILSEPSRWASATLTMNEGKMTTTFREEDVMAMLGLNNCIYPNSRFVAGAV